MSPPPVELFRSWRHSFEEDEGDISVYRPAEFEFPRARGRAGLEFLSDGQVIEVGIGRGDAPTSTTGRWEELAPGQLRLSPPGSPRADLLEIVSLDSNVLKVRRRGI